MTQDYDRISIHGVRRILLEQQVEAIGLQLEKIFIKKGASNVDYEAEFIGSLKKYADCGISSVVFGDIFLEDVRRYREELVTKVGLQAVFPLWKKDTLELARDFVDCGFNAVITVVDSNVLGKEFVGREYDKEFISDLPKGVDSCGENGEFHSFVYNGPNFKKPVKFIRGKVQLREKRFWYCDIIP